MSADTENDNQNYSQEDYANFKRDMDLAKSIQSTSPSWFAQMAPDISREMREYKKVLPAEVYNKVVSGLE